MAALAADAAAMRAAIGAAARARAAELRDGLAQRLRAELPGLRVDVEGEAIRLSGRDARRRWDAADADDLLRENGA